MKPGRADSYNRRGKHALADWSSADVVLTVSYRGSRITGTPDELQLARRSIDRAIAMRIVEAPSAAARAAILREIRGPELERVQQTREARRKDENGARAEFKDRCERRDVLGEC